MKIKLELDARGTLRYVRDVGEGVNETREIHRDDGGPAVIYADGTFIWCTRGVTHRDGEDPAVFERDGTKKWYHFGRLRNRREADPAIVHHHPMRAGPRAVFNAWGYGYGYGSLEWTGL